MTGSPHSRKKIAFLSPQSKKQGHSITSQEVMNLALKTVKEKIPLTRPEGAHYKSEDIFSTVLYAAAHKTTIEQSCQDLEEAPHPNTVRIALTPLNVEQLESQINEGLATSLPKNLLKLPVEAAIDLKLIPYYGEVKEGEEDFLLSGEPHKGTTKFFGYASMYLIKKNKRFTLAVKVVRRSEGILGVLMWLLNRFAELGGEIRCLYLDRQFYEVKVLRFLIEERDIPFAMPAPKKGKKGGIKGLLSREGMGVFPYTVRSLKEGEVSVQVAIVGRYYKGRWKKHKRERYAFVVYRFPFRIDALFGKYRRRFGIETSHRIWEQARGRTASRLVNLRLLLVGLAVLLHNLWVLLKWTVISLPRQGGRLVLSKQFSFHRLLSFLAEEL